MILAGDILTWKLVSEDILKASGLAYAIVRPCGLTEEDQDTPFELEVRALTGLDCEMLSGDTNRIAPKPFLGFIY